MRSPKLIDRQKIALVLVDLQRGYCDPSSDAAKLLDWDVGDADKACQNHVPFLTEIRKLLPPKRILWLKMEEAKSTLASNMAYGPHLGPDIFVPLCVRGTPGHDFHIVQPAEDEPQFLKFHFSGFHSKEFRDYLEKDKITQLAFSGVIRSRCVNATVLAASALGYECVLVDDLITGPQDMEAEMREHGKLTKFFYAPPIQSADFLQLLQNS